MTKNLFDVINGLDNAARIPALRAVTHSAMAKCIGAIRQHLREEARNARGAQLAAVTPEQAMANELQRCARLPPFYKTDCEARVRGQAGQESGSVIGGGIFMESVTTMPQAELQAMKDNPKLMQMPMPLMPPK